MYFEIYLSTNSTEDFYSKARNKHKYNVSSYKTEHIFFPFPLHSLL